MHRQPGNETWSFLKLEHVYRREPCDSARASGDVWIRWDLEPEDILVLTLSTKSLNLAVPKSREWSDQSPGKPKIRAGTRNPRYVVRLSSRIAVLHVLQLVRMPALCILLVTMTSGILQELSPDRRGLLSQS